jgi:glycoside hydrolase family 25
VSEAKKLTPKLKKRRKKNTTIQNNNTKKKHPIRNFFIGFFLLLIVIGIASGVYIRTYYPAIYQKILNKLTIKINSTYENERIERIVGLHYNKIFGIDLSHYQERDEIQWDSLYIHHKNARYPLQFAIFRATMGNEATDKNFAHFFDEAKKHQLIRGAYHYYRPDEDPVLQAQSYLKNAPLQTGDLLPIIDVEQLPKTKTKEQFITDIQKWMDIVEKHYQRKPILYTYISFYEDYLYPAFKQYPLWVANYNNVAAPTSVFKWQLWQFTENGITAGAKAKIDFNIFNGNIVQLNEFLLK